MAEKPILFNTEMVRAILGGRKNTTRRVVKPQPLGRIAYCMAGYKHGAWIYPGDTTYLFWGEEWRVPEGLKREERNRHWEAPYHTDDILYVRETWAAWSQTEGLAPTIHYKADEENLPGVKWRPSIHMPREAARIFLRVTDVRVERLQEIDEDGIRAEGLTSACVHAGDMEIAAQEFALLWNSTIKPADQASYGWQANPWVWVIAFERAERPVTPI